MSDELRALNELLGAGSRGNGSHFWGAMVTGISSFLSNDLVRLLISSIGGAAIAYMVLVVRIDERQQVNTKAISEQHAEIESLKRRAEENARINAQQQTMIELEGRQHQIEMNLMRRDIAGLQKDLVAHELEDKRRFAK